MLADECEENIMTKENQKILYDHYIKLSKDGNTDKIRADAKLRAADILGSFPDFAKAVKAPEKEPEKTDNFKPGDK